MEPKEAKCNVYVWDSNKLDLVSSSNDFQMTFAFEL